VAQRDATPDERAAFDREGASPTSLECAPWRRGWTSRKASSSS
jgi:hypothetical protein